MQNNIFRKPFSYSFSSITLYLIAVNILVLLLGYVVNQNYLYYYFSLSVSGILQGHIWQFVTYMFLHDPSNLSHILLNMLGLFMFGLQVERSLGSKEFLLFYLSTGILSGIASFLIYYFSGTDVYLIGASGAIYALLLAYAVIFPDSVIYFFAILPIRAPIAILIFAGLSLFSQFTGYNGGVAHFTHLAGLAFAWIYFIVRFGVYPEQRLFPRK